jgi:tellurite resistance protein TerC
MEIVSIGTPTLWAGFTIFVLAMLAIDLGIFNRKAHVEGFKESIVWTSVWIILALIFNVGVWHWFGKDPALEFITGYLIEKALAVDNIFIFMVIFSSFKVPRALHHHVLFWGILGVLILRGIFIAIGAVLLQKFHWIIYPFGLLLVITGIKLFVERASNFQPENNAAVRLFKRLIPMTPNFHGKSFIIFENGKMLATPLLLVIFTIEITDVIFAIDSIPAIFAVTSDPFIVYTSNIFAILGLRSLYFAIAGSMEKFHYLKVGLSLVLVFVGVKMLVGGFYKIPIVISLFVVIFLIAGAILASVFFPPEKPDMHQN